MKMLICHNTLPSGEPCPAQGQPVMWDDQAAELGVQQMRDEYAADGNPMDVALAVPWCGACSSEYTDIRDAGDGQ